MPKKYHVVQYQTDIGTIMDPMQKLSHVVVIETDIGTMMDSIAKIITCCP